MGKNFENSLVAAAVQGRRQAGVVGSSKTDHQIKTQARLIARAVVASGFPGLQSARNLSEKHVRAAMTTMSQTRSVRTMQNITRSLRYVLDGTGKTHIRDRLTNQELGFAGASRQGTKTAITPETFARVHAAILALEDKRRAAALSVVVNLSRYGGLRISECRMAGTTAQTNVRELVERGTITVRDGTKGGRLRRVDVAPANVHGLKDALHKAAEICKTEGHLWPGKNSRAAAQNLSKYCAEVGLKGAQSHHSLRYAFARSQYQNYLSQGLAKNEALRALSLDLGHGDGRGRYVEQVYLR